VTPAELSAIHAACFTTPRPWTEAEFAGYLTNRHVFLLEEEGGFLLGRVIADEAELLTIAVAPVARRAGIGRRLVRGFLAEAARRGAVTAFLEVADTNAPAIALYRAAGFAASGRRKGYYTLPEGGAVDAIVMQTAP
jgi:ribosomal-protein-alanine N-acetyltransferase